MDIGAGGIIGSKYRLERPLSRGGMGAVWAARHIALEQAVAIKLMEPELAQRAEFRERFNREARVVARLESPHVVQVKDFGVEDEIPYLVMELLRGEDVGRRLRRVQRLGLAETVRIAGQAAKALRCAHDGGLVHRDLKPSNLFIAHVGGEECLKILDFGIVKVTSGTLSGGVTRTGELLGTPFYMSPEQVRGDKGLDLRSDLWSLAVILFELVTGRRPFDGDNFGAVLARILVDPPPLATAWAPDLPATLDGFFARALLRDPGERFQSAMELAMAFRAAVEVNPRDAAFSVSQLPMSWPSLPPGPATPSSIQAGAASILPGPGREGTPSAVAMPVDQRSTVQRWALVLGALAVGSGLTAGLLFSLRAIEQEEEGMAAREGRQKASATVNAAVLGASSGAVAPGDAPAGEGENDSLPAVHGSPEEAPAEAMVLGSPTASAASPRTTPRSTASVPIKAPGRVHPPTSLPGAERKPAGGPSLGPSVAPSPSAGVGSGEIRDPWENRR
ncbi:serine/threonine-protein kinase [Chondromyces crocatus]|uniref:Protein kinase domain-containing protein n=1 Tax=Chondromyces crocatus TaxID=52 RepID=A0A0K1EEE2_CHOCO|nr:serine/threonine-protein kinase [Chondromyces crocatus]AKT38948.1 uncharacterized protein CMC5_030950 [Chondromyces crocatus]